MIAFIRAELGKLPSEVRQFVAESDGNFPIYEGVHISLDGDKQDPTSKFHFTIGNYTEDLPKWMRPLAVEVDLTDKCGSHIKNGVFRYKKATAVVNSYPERECNSLSTKVQITTTKAVGAYGQAKRLYSLLRSEQLEESGLETIEDWGFPA